MDNSIPLYTFLKQKYYNRDILRLFLKKKSIIYKISCFFIVAVIIFNLSLLQYGEMDTSSKTDKITPSNLNNLTYKTNSATSQNNNLSALSPHSLGILETQEAGTFTKNQSASTPAGNSVATLLDANLSSLKYGFSADTEPNGTITQDWQIPVDNNSGRAPGSILTDTKNFVQGTASTHFIMNKTASTWYTNFNEPVWNDSALPSPFLYSTLLTGYFSFNATNLTSDPYGYISMLRFAFPPTSGLSYSAINVFMNISSGYSVPSSGIQVDSICCVLGIYLGQNKSDQRVQVWKQQNSWYGFKINLTAILQAAYPVNSSLYSSATQVFTNLTKTWIELESQTQSSGTLHLWIDDLQWQTNLSKTFTKQWINNNPPFINKNGNHLLNQSLNIPYSSSWGNINGEWYVITKNVSILTNTLPIHSPYVPLWSFQRTDVYIYSFNWDLTLNNSQWWNACQSIMPSLSFTQNPTNQCDPSQSLSSMIKILPAFFQYNTSIKSSINIIFSWQLFHNSISLAPQNYSLYTNPSMAINTQFIPNYKLSSSQNSIIQSTIYAYTSNNTFSGWYTFQWTASLSSLGFKVFPLVKLQILVPNLLNIENNPELSITQQGLVLNIAINQTLVNQYLPLIVQIYDINASWINKGNYILGNNPSVSVFIAWKQPINPDDHIFLQMLINSSQDIGWYSTSFIPGNNLFNNNQTGNSSQNSNQSIVPPLSENNNTSSFLNGDSLLFVVFYGICSIIGITIITMVRRSQRKHITKDLFEE